MSIFQCAHESRLDKAREQSQSSTAIGIRMRTVVFAFAVFLVLAGPGLRAQGEPNLVPDVVDYKKLLPLLPEPPAGWTADKAEGQTEDGVTTAHRDYKKGEGDNVPIASISIVDSAANPDYISLTTTGWALQSETPEGYSKSVTIDGNPGSESYEKEQKHATLRLLIGKRYFLAIDLQNLDPKELQEWLKLVDLKKLAEIK